MLTIPVLLSSFQSLKDKTLKITFETLEPSPEEVSQIAKHNQTFGYLAFKEDKFKTQEIEILDSLKSDFQSKGKTKSQRLRAVLYRNFEQNSEGYEVFDDYYNAKMEKLINFYKDKLD